MISLHAVLAIGFGIAFDLYGPLMMAFFAVPEVLEIDAMAYWQLAAFLSACLAQRYSDSVCCSDRCEVQPRLSIQKPSEESFSLYCLPI